MKIVFTLCSNNYLAHAKTLFDSFQRNNVGYTFFVGLADKLLNDYSQFPAGTVLPVEQVVDSVQLHDMASRYDIVEFNTAIKPYYLEYFLNMYPDAEIITYLDPDIVVHGSFSEVESELGTNNILLTPHIITPYGVDDHLLSEATFLSYGLYNLGFIALRNNLEVKRFIQWWKERLYTLCVIDFEKGLFTDQKWINYAPLFFKNVKISYHSGLNAAYWNLHERQIHKTAFGYQVNEQFPLIFFHISGFNAYNPDKINKVQTRIDLKIRTDDAHLIYKGYAAELINNKVQEFSKLPYGYANWYQKGQENRLRIYLASNINNKLFYHLYKFIPSVLRRFGDAFRERIKVFNTYNTHG